MKDNHPTPEQPSPTHFSMSLEELLALMIADALSAPTEFDRERAAIAIQIIGAGMSLAEIKGATARASALIRASEA